MWLNVYIAFSHHHHRIVMIYSIFIKFTLVCLYALTGESTPASGSDDEPLFVPGRYVNMKRSHRRTGLVNRNNNNNDNNNVRIEQNDYTRQTLPVASQLSDFEEEGEDLSFSFKKLKVSSPWNPPQVLIKRKELKQTGGNELSSLLGNLKVSKSCVGFQKRKQRDQ